MMSLTIAPVGAKGDSAPACAPLPTIRAMRNGETAARAPTAMAIGARIAVVAMLPGPMLDRASAIRKNMIGMTPALPRHSRTAREARRPSVPLRPAIPKSRVTPTRVRNSWIGNVPITVLSGMPPRYTPTIHANASDTTPTFTWVNMLSVIATSSATSEIHARFIGSPPGANEAERPGATRARR